MIDPVAQRGRTSNHQVPLLELSGVRRSFSQGSREVEALRGVDLEVMGGEKVVVMGPSGSGKSTLLHVAAGLDRPTAGRVRLAGVDISALDETEAARRRREDMGFVFQFFNLMPTLTAAENVALPLDLAGIPWADARERAHARLESVGLASRADHYPEHLSGGEMQRVAVARALVSDPYIVFADEPTGNLDSRAGSEVLDLLSSATGDGRALVMVTHDPSATRIATRQVLLVDGRLQDATT